VAGKSKQPGRGGKRRDAAQRRLLEKRKEEESNPKGLAKRSFYVPHDLYGEFKGMTSHISDAVIGAMGIWLALKDKAGLRERAIQAGKTVLAAKAIPAIRQDLRATISDAVIEDYLQTLSPNSKKRLLTAAREAAKRSVHNPGKKDE